MEQDFSLSIHLSIHPSNPPIRISIWSPIQSTPSTHLSINPCIVFIHFLQPSNSSIDPSILFLSTQLYPSNPSIHPFDPSIHSTLPFLFSSSHFSTHSLHSIPPSIYLSFKPNPPSFHQSKPSTHPSICLETNCSNMIDSLK